MRSSTPLLILATALAAGLAGCSQGEGAKPAAAPQAAEVSVVTLKAEQTAVSNELPGRTTAYTIADVRPQVGGLIQKRLFEEGTEVRAGQALYQIAPETYQATLESAQASLLNAQAALTSAKLKYERYNELGQIEAVSKEARDEAEAAYKQALATVASSKASVTSAQLNVGFTRVTAPISGRIGRSSVTPGALVTASQTTALATVQQLDPIYVDLTQSSTDLLRIRKDMESGKLKMRGDGHASVKLVMEDGSVYPQEGKLLLAEATVDQTAGSVTLRAVFPNPKRDLLPGMYVRASVQGTVVENAILVPQTAVSRDARGNATALVVNAENKVEARTLQTAQAINGKWLVNQGLNAGDRVIVEGLQKAKAGATVRATEYGATPAPGAAGAPNAAAGTASQTPAAGGTSAAAQGNNAQAAGK